MDCDIPFPLEIWDERSNTSTLHLSYFIQNLLPLRLIGWKTVRRHYDGVMSGFNRKSQNSSCTDSVLSFIITGSIAEGFGIPFCLAKSSPHEMERISDVDALMVPRGLLISTNEVPLANTTEYKGYFESYEGLHPGYTRIGIRPNKNEHTSFIRDPETGKYYLSGTKIMAKLCSSLESVLRTSETVWVQGPALTIEDNRIATFETPNAGSSRDLVTALKCTPWPREAKAWKGRALKSEWLPNDLIQSIIDDGCHVVPVPSKNSLNPEIEWRMSFSASEGRIAREAVTDYQRQCYIYLKILRYQVMKPVSVLSSYVFKSVFLHSCEKLPIENWELYPGNCILYMLDVILHCLRKKHVPTYFLPENNLIDFMNDEELKAAIDAVETIRRDPFMPALEFTDERIIGYQSINASYREIMEPLLEDMKLFPIHRRTSLSLQDGMLRTSTRMCHLLLHEQTGDEQTELVKHKEAVRIMIDFFWQWMHPSDPNVSFVQFISDAGFATNNLEMSARYFRAVNSLSSEYPGFLPIRGNLACIYHCLAYADRSEAAKPNEEYIKRAGKLFEEIYGEDKSSVIDYLAYLVKLKKFGGAITILEDWLQTRNDQERTNYEYDKKEMNCLEDPLKSHISEFGRIGGEDIAFAYFYFVKCLVASSNAENDNTKKINDVLERFEEHCKDKTDENTKQLYKYAKDVVEAEVAGK
ncbi:hypothetical protein ACF0H5_007433 [Mactra antiquata]